MALGLLRLATGLWVMRRLRLRSEPLLDPAWRDTLDILRAEMRCMKPVELRFSADLDTAATIGWHRVLIFLPADWQTWDDAERRAVLAHELAHVCRGDFLTGLLAQVCLASQFYHPLAHWLSARLRLEQELAADAWSARLSGGTLPYLTTLAQLALRRDDRSLGWPARAFLPSRGTFVRRIEMLRNSKHVRHVWLSSTSRFLTMGGLASLGLLIAGFRGPLATPAVTAQTAAAANDQAGDSPRLPGTGFDLKFIPAETKMLVAARPAAILDRPEFRSFLKSLSEAQIVLLKLLPPKETAELLVFWEGLPANPGGPGTTPLIIPGPSGFVARMHKPTSWKTHLSNPSPEETRHAGQTYLRNVGGHGWSVFTPDDRTLVAAPEDLLRVLIEDRDVPAPRHAWDDAWNQVGKGQLNVAFETRWLRRRLKLDESRNLDAGGLKYETISPLLEKTRSYAIGIDLEGELKTDLVAIANAQDSVKPVTETLQALLTLGRNALPSLRREVPHQEGFGEAKTWFFDVIATLLENATIQTAGQTVHLRSNSPVEHAKVSRVLSAFLQGARTDAQRQQSVNNLKQIGLAIHNYAAANNHLPPPVLYGGSTGKVPYSWRVAILPYLEGQDLYNQYNFNEPWDGPNNRKLIDKMPAIYGYPGLTGANQSQPSYFVFTGPETILGKGAEPSFADVFDGTSNTILAVEAKRDIPWTKPEDIPFDPKAAPPEVGGFTPDGFDALLGDGSVRHIKKSINPILFKALITRAGGEVIDQTSF